MTVVPRRVRVAEELPEIVEHLDVEQREVARRQLVAELIVAKTGSWRPPVPDDRPGHLGLLVLDGLLRAEFEGGSCKKCQIWWHSMPRPP